MEIADERLAGTEVQCYVTPGNDDLLGDRRAAQVVAERVQFVEGTRVRLDERHEMITTGYSNITPVAIARASSPRRSWRTGSRICSPASRIPST